MPDQYGAPTLEELAQYVEGLGKAKNTPEQKVPQITYEKTGMSLDEIFRSTSTGQKAQQDIVNQQKAAEEQARQQQIYDETRPTGYGEQFLRGAKAQGAAVFGGLADYLKSQAGERPQFDESKVPVEQRESGLVTHAKNISEYMGGVQEANRPQKQYTPSEMIPFASDYWTNPRGAAYDIGGGVGSTAALAPVTVAISATLPEAVPVAVAGGAAKLLQRIGLLEAAEKAVSKGGVELAKWATTGAVSKVPEALSEGGNVAKELEKEGYSKDEIRAAANFVAMANIPTLMVEGALEMSGLTGALGKMIGKPGAGIIKNIAKGAAVNLPAQAVTEGLTELRQEQISAEALGKPHGEFFSPSTWTPQEIEAAAKGMVGSLGLGVPGSVIGGVRASRQAKAATATPTTQAEETTVTGEPTQPQAQPAGPSGLDLFKRAVASVETQGQPDPYTAKNSIGAYGKYQFMPDTWAGVMRQMGLPEDTPMTPEMQEKAADFHMTDLYNKLGSWDKVAVAWQAGEQHGDKSDEELSQMGDGGLSTLEYKNKVMAQLGRHEAIDKYEVPVPKYIVGESTDWENVTPNLKTGIHILIDEYNKQFPDDTLTITDAKRDPESAIGSPTSYHKTGGAADLWSEKLIANDEDGANRRAWLENRAKELGFREVLNEIDRPSEYATGPHFHVAAPSKEFNYKKVNKEDYASLKDRAKEIQAVSTDPEEVNEIDLALKSKKTLLTWAEKNGVTPEGKKSESIEALEGVAEQQAKGLRFGQAPDEYALKEQVMPKVENQAQVGIKNNMETAKVELEKTDLKPEEITQLLADQQQKHEAIAANTPILSEEQFDAALKRTFKQAKQEGRDFTVADIEPMNVDSISPEELEAFKFNTFMALEQAGIPDLQVFESRDKRMQVIIPDSKRGILDEFLKNAAKTAKDGQLKVRYAEYAGARGPMQITKALLTDPGTIISPVEATIQRKAVPLESTTGAKKLTETSIADDYIKGSPGEFSTLKRAYEMFGVKEVPFKELTKEEQTLVKFSHSFGVALRFVEGREGFNGMHVGGTTIINRNAALGMEWTFWHETLHWMKSESRELYWMVRRHLEGELDITPEQEDSYRSRITNGKQEGPLGGYLLTREDIIEEIIADAMADNAVRQRLISDMIAKNPTLAEKFVDFVKKLYAKLYEMVTGKPLTEEALQAKPWIGLTQEQVSAIEQGLTDLAYAIKDDERQDYSIPRSPEANAEFEKRVYGALDEYRTLREKQRDEYFKKRDAEEAAKKEALKAKREAKKAAKAKKEQIKESRVQIGPKPAPNVMVEQKQTPYTPNVFERYIYTLRKLANKYPRAKMFVSIGARSREVQSHIRNYFTHQINKWEKVLKQGNYKENSKDLSGVLWQGDHDGREYTKEELAKDGYNNQVIEAYLAVRRNVKKAHKMLNEAKQKIKTHSRVVTSEGLTAIQNSRFKEVLSVVPQDGGRYLVTYRSPKTWMNYLILSQDELNELQRDPNTQINKVEEYKSPRAKPGQERLVRGKGFFRVEFEQQEPPLAERRGYISHFFHQYFIMKEVNGEKEVVGSGRTPKEAIERANRLAEAEPNSNFFIQPKKFELPGEAEQAAIIGDKEYSVMMKKLAEDLSIPLAQAKDLMSDKAVMKNRRRFFGQFEERTGAEGFEKDMDWVLRHYFNAVGRYIAMDEFKGEAISRFEKTYGRFDDGYTGEAQFIKNYINDVLGVPPQAEKELNDWLEDHPALRQFLGHFLGDRPSLELASKLTRMGSIMALNVLNVASSVMQLAQVINAYSLIGDAKYTAKALKHAISPTLDDKVILARCAVDSSLNLSSGAGYSAAEQFSKLLKYSTWTFQKMDLVSRRTAVLGSYWKAIDEGKSRAEAIEIAKTNNSRANFENAVDNAPDIFRRTGPIGQVLLQFQKYPIMQMELMIETILEAKKTGNYGPALRLWLPTLALSGMWGFPGIGVMGSLLGILIGKDWEKEVKKSLFEWAGKDEAKQAVAKQILYGLGAQAGIDISRRVGIGDFGTVRLPNDGVEAFGKLFGVAGSMVVRASQQAAQGNYVEGIKAMNPGLGNMLQAYIGETYDKRHREGYTYETFRERLMRGLGFSPIEETIQKDITGITRYELKEKREESAKLIDEYIEARKTGDKEKIANAQKKLTEAKIPASSVREEMKKKGKDIKERTKEDTPKKYRDEFKHFQEFGQ